MPDRDETGLQQAAEVVQLVIEQSMTGLSTLAHETRQWLKSAQQYKIAMRPMAQLQNPESQGRYTLYMQRFVCYCLRVAAVEQEADRWG